MDQPRREFRHNPFDILDLKGETEHQHDVRAGDGQDQDQEQSQRQADGRGPRVVD